MTEVTQILNVIEQVDPKAADKLLPLVYEELRKLAARKLAQEKPGQTLQATALVHEAYVRLVEQGCADSSSEQHWDHRGHFFAALQEALRSSSRNAELRPIGARLSQNELRACLQAAESNWRPEMPEWLSRRE